MTQEKALKILKTGYNVFLTGSAGTGKTFVLNKYIGYLRKHKVAFAKSASTGLAASHIDGQTIHSWSGIGVKEELNVAYLKKLKKKKFFKKKMNLVKVLIIDEISMLHKNQFEMVDKVLQFFKENEKPFGGIQVILSGDFFQLPPIGMKEEKSKDKFVFMSKSWINAKFLVCYLSRQYRQKNRYLHNLLNQIRDRTISKESLDLLIDRIKDSPDNQEVTCLYTHNVDVDRKNEMQLELLTGRSRKYKARSKGNPAIIPILKKSVLAKETIFLKKGAKVMFVRNNFEKGYQNGTLGEVIGFNDSGFPKVLIGKRVTIEVKPEKWTIEDELGKELASYLQIPIRLAWAITIHKSQGMTLDSAEVNLSYTFESGQGYVALSRVKSLEGLFLVGINKKALDIDPLVFKANKRFKELGEELNNKYTIKELNAMSKDFLNLVEGEASNVREGFKKSYEYTRDFLLKGFSIDEIANSRGLTKSSIIKHIVILKNQNKDLDISKYLPDDEKMKEIKRIYKSWNHNNPIRKQKIYNLMKGSVSYDQIAVALAELNSLKYEK